MQLEENKIYHMDNRQGLLMLPEKSVNLIIADPPYFEVKGDFDFVWKSFDEYLEFMEEQAKLYKRVLADNGSLFVYGHAKKIAYVQTIFDKYFNLENNITWWVYDRQTNKGVENFRCFAPVTERILYYSNEIGMTGLQMIDREFISPRNPFAKELKKARIKKGVSIKEVAEYGKFYGNVNHGGAVTNWEKGYNVPLKEQWSILCKFLPIVRQEYEELRQEYEELRRPFNNYLKLTDVMKFSQEAHITGQYDHETVKPEKLTRALILTCSKENDLIVVPFTGSGTECAMAAKERRRFIGFEIHENHTLEASKRVEYHLRRPSLFSAV